MTYFNAVLTFTFSGWFFQAAAKGKELNISYSHSLLSHSSLLL